MKRTHLLLLIPILFAVAAVAAFKPDEPTASTVAAVSQADKSFQITVNTPLTITTGSPLATAATGSAYSQIINATGGVGAYRWSIVTGTLPPGLVLDSITATISGTPTTAGIYNFALRVTDGH